VTVITSESLEIKSNRLFYSRHRYQIAIAKRFSDCFSANRLQTLIKFVDLIVIQIDSLTGDATAGTVVVVCPLNPNTIQ